MLCMLFMLCIGERVDGVDGVIDDRIDVGIGERIDVCMICVLCVLFMLCMLCMLCM